MTDKILHDAENCVVLDKKDYELAISKMKKISSKADNCIKKYRKERGIKMKECKCKDWKENNGILTSALILHTNHGFSKGLKKSFTYCPYCGKELEEVEEK